MKVCLFFMVFCGLAAGLPGCESIPVDSSDASGDKPALATLVFSVRLNRDAYEASDWGEAPQFAFWLEDPQSGGGRTVWVTYRTGAGDWVGKVECPVSLPYWASRYQRETTRAAPPTIAEPVVAAVTGATPRQELKIETAVSDGSRWDYFFEVNVSGDFNIAFPSMRSNGAPDPYGNGQPSLIYRGQIEAVAGARDTPQLIGRTDQWRPIDYVIADLDGITTAKHLLSQIEVVCFIPRSQSEQVRNTE